MSTQNNIKLDQETVEIIRHLKEKGYTKDEIIEAMNALDALTEREGEQDAKE